MSKTIKGLGNDSVRVKGRTVTGVLAAITLQHDTANTAITNSMFDATKTTLKVTLIRGGKSKDVCSDNLKVLAADSAFQDAGWDCIFGTSNVQLQAPAVGVKARALITYQVDFHSPINVRENDQLVINMTVNNGTYSAVLDLSGSQIEFSEIQGEGSEYGFPIIESYALNTGDSQHTVETRDNVKQVTLINLDKTDNLEASAVVSQKALVTDEINITRQYLEMLTERTEEFPSIPLANTRNQSFILAKGEDYDKCSVELQLNSSNVNGGQNYIIVRRLEVTADSIIHGETRSALKGMERAMKKGVPVNQDVMNKLRQQKSMTRKKMRSNG